MTVSNQHSEPIRRVIDGYVRATGQQAGSSVNAMEAHDALDGLLEQVERQGQNIQALYRQKRSVEEQLETAQAELTEWRTSIATERLQEQLETLRTALEQAEGDLRTIKVKAETSRADAPVWQLPNEIAHLVSGARSRISAALSNPATSSGTEPVSRREVAGVSVPETSSPASSPTIEEQLAHDYRMGTTPDE